MSIQIYADAMLGSGGIFGSSGGLNNGRWQKNNKKESLLRQDSVRQKTEQGYGPAGSLPEAK
jgi:hypothetical protein